MNVRTRWATACICCVTGGAAAAAGLQLVDDPDLGEFIEIVGFGGVQLVLGADGEAFIPGATFPGNFVLQAGQILVGENGGVAFGAATISDLEAVNQPIPSQDAFMGNQAALVFWDDIDDKDGDSFYLSLKGHPDLDDRVIVQWDFGNFDGNGSVLKFQVQIFPNPEPTGLYAQYAYRIEGPAMSAGTSATIGYQDGEAGHGDLQLSFNTPGVVIDGTVISLLIPDATVCPGDLDGDCRTDIDDFLILLVQWGWCGDCAPAACPADLDGDCVVGIGDLLFLLANWS